MIILGVSHMISANPAACLLIDGQLIAMVEEERLNRIKYSHHFAPTLATEYCLQCAGLTMQDVDVVAVGFGPPTSVAFGILRSEGIRDGWPLAKIWHYRTAYYAQFTPGRQEGKKIVYVNHHLAHAASAFYPSGFSHANILSIDGTGGSEAGFLGYGNERGITVLNRISNFNSWGKLYEDVTVLLGFSRLGGEGKTMGLAPYGHTAPEGFPFINWSSEVPQIDNAAKEQNFAAITPRQPTEPLKQEHKDLAATLQHTLERAALCMVAALHRRTGLRQLCLAGGVALNCSMNGVLLRSPYVDDIFIQPVAHDGGTALGAALYVYTKQSRKKLPFTMTHAYWGPEYDNDAILAALNKAGIKSYRPSADICQDTAQILKAGKIVGWFQGRAEVGPRALGARSILADPSDPTMKDRINLRVKRREPWRPFAPSILHEYVGQYIEHTAASPFMILAFQSTPEAREHLISAIHIDNSCRPQTVQRDVAPRYWNLIEAFRQQTGIPALLNTSFNIDSQPIVCSPEDAIDTFLQSGIDYLAIGDYLVWKNTSDPAVTTP